MIVDSLKFCSFVCSSKFYIMKKIMLIVCFLSAFFISQAQHQSQIAPLDGEKWWGCFVGIGHEMPFASNTPLYDLSKVNFNNEASPLLLSSQGRYVWSEEPFRFQLKNDTLLIESDYETPQVTVAGTTLREAYLHASKAHFPANGKTPPELFFKEPQYNTWIELMYNQNQKDILDYAHQIIENGFPKGILMIDDNWQRYYGNFEFKAEKFPDARAMTDELHRLGFKVMLWISPFVSADSPEYRDLEAKGFLLKDKSGAPAVVNWWNGYSACYDMTNPAAVESLKQTLNRCMETYGIDGFKFDAGDIAILANGEYDYYDRNADQNIFSQRWAELGLSYPFNEFRAAWKTGGLPLVQRIGDKDYSWEAVSMLIPNMAICGMLGYPYACPDMIGGGQFTSFLNIEPGEFNEELIVRSCQVHALMPMMQFSVAPWRILSPENMEICARYARLHHTMGDYIYECARHAAETGEPILRHMEYCFPHSGFTDCKDQFMLGDKYMIAPMTTSGDSRTVYLPKGKWRDDRGKTFKGPKKIEIDVPLDRLPYYERIK